MCNAIEKLVNERFTDIEGNICSYDKDDNSISDVISKFLDNSVGSDYNRVDIETIEDNPGVTIRYLACSWIEDGYLYTFNTPIYDY